MATLRTTLPSLYLSRLAFLEDVLFDEMPIEAGVFQRILKVRDMGNKPFVKTTTVASFGQVPIKPEGAAVTYEDLAAGFDATYQADTYELAFRASKEALDDEQEEVVSDAARALGSSMNFTYDVDHANCFNLGFSTFTSPDAVSLFNTSHPLIGGGINQNRPTTDGDLSVAQLRVGLTDIMNTKDDAGKIVHWKPKILLCSENQKWLAMELIGSDPAPEPHGRDCVRELTTAWELLHAGAWHPLVTHDDTRGLTLDGVVRLRARVAADPERVGAVPQPLHWIRCRAAGGVPDEPPVLTDAAVNAVVASQRVPVRSRLPLAPGAVLEALQVGARLRLEIEADEQARVTRVRRTSSRLVPKVRLLAADASSLELTASLAGLGDGNPEQRLELADAPVADGAVAVWSTEADGPHAWEPRLDFDAAGAVDRVVTLDAQHGVLAFGDGEHGAALRPGAALLAAYDVTLGAGGNVPSSAAWSAAPPFDSVAVTARGAASGGADAEDLVTAAGRAAEKLWAHERLLELAAGATTLDGLPRKQILALPEPQRAATGLDYERLAVGVPGTRIRRARAWPELDAGAPGLRAPGTVTVVVVNAFPPGRPRPGQALLDRVERYLRRRKTIGTRLVVAPPDYVEVTVTATLRGVAGADAAALSGGAVAALDGFLDPLGGGPAGLGWPFGRNVYRAEVLALLNGVDGVDAVTSLDLQAGDGEPTCGNVCVGPAQLVVSGTHTVEVVA